MLFNLKKPLWKSQQSQQQPQEAVSLPADRNEDLGYLFIQVIVTDGFLGSIQNITGCERGDAANAAASLDLQSIVDGFYLSVLKNMSKESLDSVASFMYGTEFKQYEQAIMLAVAENQQKMAATIAMVCDVDATVVH